MRDDFFTTKEFADRYGLSVQRVRTLITCNRITGSVHKYGMLWIPKTATIEQGRRAEPYRTIEQQKAFRKTRLLSTETLNPGVSDCKCGSRDTVYWDNGGEDRGFECLKCGAVNGQVIP